MKDAPWEQITEVSFSRKLKDLEKKSKIIDVFLKNIKKRDLREFKVYIEDEDVFEEPNKHKFYNGLNELIFAPIYDDVQNFEMKEGHCTGCSLGEKVYEFFINNDFEFAYSVQDGIRRCWKSSSCEKS